MKLDDDREQDDDLDDDSVLEDVEAEEDDAELLTQREASRASASETALGYLTDLVESAECDRESGEIVLTGRWGRDGALEQERFQSVEDVRDFLGSFGWIRETGDVVALVPFAPDPIVNHVDIDPLITRLVEEHELKNLIVRAQDFNPEMKLFDFRELSRDRLVSGVRLQLETANALLIKRLAVNPSLMHKLDPRQLEEVVAEIFDSLGFQVVLTPRTRDGGYDVRAIRSDSLGTFLYLIECKRNAPDRPVGVELVRALYGTVVAERATHGILATTSYFSRDAAQFARGVRYQLSLRDYNNLKDWIAGYRSSQGRASI